jgi:hypothetical protein
MTFQEFIHKWEVGAGQRLVTVTAAILAFVGLAVWYDVRAFRGLSTVEGMDAAQLARNIARGEGYKTSFIRPFSVHLVKSRQEARTGENQGTSGTNGDVTAEQAKPATVDKAEDKRPPDVTNAPLFPALLAGVLKAMPFDYPDLILAKSFTVYTPDAWIAGFNQLLLLGVLVLVFRLGRSLFDAPVGWMSVLVLAGTELCWRLTGAGHGTVLLMGLVLGILMVLARIDMLARETDIEEAERSKKMMLLAAGAGALVGMAALTRYSLAALIVPVVAALASLPGGGATATAPLQATKKTTLAATAAIVFVLLLLPWVVRNYTISGALFGTAGYSVATDAGFFTADELERSLKPDLNRIEPWEIWRKILTNNREIIEKHLPNFAGSSVTALFLAGLLVPFRNPTLSRLRWVVVGFVVALLFAQAASKTALSKKDYLVSSENLLVVVAPAAVIFGMGFLSVLLQGLVGPALRLMATGIVVGLAWVPFLISLTAFHGAALYPPGIQEKALGVAEKERIMSDLPWAMAWYGDRTSVWLSLTHRDAQGPGDDFYSLHRAVPVSALYLGGEGLNAITTTAVAQWREESGARQGDDWTEFLRVASSLMKRLDTEERKEELEALRRLLQVADQHWAYGAEKTWAEFLLGIYVNSEVPTGFPLKRAPFGLWPELFLTDTERNPPN